MDNNQPMTLLLIDDDLAECIRYRNCATNRDDIRFVGMTGSSFEGMSFLMNHMPEGVILDLELHRGKGSGLMFLSSLNKTKLNYRPLVVVITNCSSDVVYNHVRDCGVDLVFYKKQADYNADMVVNSLLALRGSLHGSSRSGLPNQLNTIETPEEQRARIADKLKIELDKVGISAHLKGRRYLYESIMILIYTQDGDGSDPVINQICNNHKRAYSSITRAMQTAINNAWRTSSIDDLQIHYTARVNYETGVPTPIEFIYYYADKLKKFL